MANKADIGIIGGSGLEEHFFSGKAEKLSLKTPFGQVKAVVGNISGKKAVFISRHGAGHLIPPHMVNYRANVFTMASFDVEAVIATAAVGSLKKSISPGSYVVMDDLIDMTKGRISSFFDKGQVIHTDMSAPYDKPLSLLLSSSVKKVTGKRPQRAVYVAVEGPRFETRAEIKMFSMLGGDVVGMTGVPEAVLAAELGLPYASLGLVTNLGCGLSTMLVSAEEVASMMGREKKNIVTIITSAVKALEL